MLSLEPHSTSAPHKINGLKAAVPTPYFAFGKRKTRAPVLRDPAVDQAEQASSSFAVPAPPIPPPELGKSGKPLTKKERRTLRQQTAGSDWFDLPAPAEADLPRLYREVEALRLRNQLDPKRFYRKEEGEGKGIKGLPKYFAIGTILPSSAPFGTTSADNLTRAKRKNTLVDELVDDAEAKRYAKRKFEDLQTIRGAKGHVVSVHRVTSTVFVLTAMADMTDQPRGVKRKRPEVNPETKFGTKLFHTIKEVQQAAKKARSFETQRLVKKLKNADGDVRQKLTAELDSLKNLDPHTFAQSTLRTRLLKDSHIKSNDVVRGAIDSQLSSGSSESKSAGVDRIRNRLSSNRTFAKVLGDAVTDLRGVILPSKEGKGPTRPKEDEDEEAEDEKSGKESEDTGASADELGEREQIVEEEGWESGSVSAVAEDDGWESGSIHSDDDAEDAKVPPTKKAKATAKPTPKPPAPSKSAQTQSQFLPSLSVGYIRGGSSSEDDDIEDVEPQRKNRRGQRARQAIWEKKYGRGANHKKKEAAEAQAKLHKNANGRDARPLGKQGPVGRSGAKPWQQQPRPQNQSPSSFKPPPAPAFASKPQAAASLHPSWAAKRALKEKAAAGIVPSQAKKIVFD
uniref:Bud22 domain-containing protein n=1 Tax=Mycena chlorophos TaxID=658473 RepID=A0ABQ0MAQ9_MYCCL|nr:predicted protein [Mycena chlorophos]